jgi:2-polyprenyl-6-methoxyphenol hydroxylase-like FAD-dependent oxidoreductase
MPDRTITTTCCIAGGGPAGMMLGFLLARAGVDVVVLEKHADFLRDFRGDTIHPSTLEVMRELGLLDEFLKLPHQEVRQLSAIIGGETVKLADFSHLPTHCKFVALMPQWDFLDFLAARGKLLSAFHLEMRAEAIDLIEEAGRTVGVIAKTPDGTLTIRAALVVGADGRHSTIRQRAGFTVDDFGAPMDVLWMRLSRKPDDPAQALGRAAPGRLLVTLDRGDYWQCAYVIPKGGFDEVRKRGLDWLQNDIAEVAPFLRDRVGELTDWDHVKLLTVTVDRLRLWHKPGLLCIGDAAHAMSPIGGVGINLAIQDAVAAANILAEPLREGHASDDVLARVQTRRTFPMRATQALQLAIQNNVITGLLGSTRQIRPPWFMRIIDKAPLLQRLPARLLGVGFRPEHVQTPAVSGNRPA